MFAEERQEKILELIREKGSVKVIDLSKTFQVSKDLIRKDLTKLEEGGQITKTYGGAILKRESAPNIAVTQRITKNSDVKDRIAKKAYSLIEDRETIFLDISTSNILIANEIANGNKKITVITNMLDIMVALSKVEHVKVIGIGGVLHKEMDGFVGSETIEYLKKYKVERCFLGTVGVDIVNNTIATFESDDGQTKKAILNSSKIKYLVMENRKFYQDGTYIFTDLNEIHGIITEISPSPDIIVALKDKGIKLF